LGWIEERGFVMFVARLQLLALLFLLLLPVGRAAAVPEATLVDAAQYGSFVFVAFDLNGTPGELEGASLELWLSSDGGATFPEQLFTLHGNTGADTLSQGPDQHLIWDAWADKPDVFIPEASVWVKVIPAKAVAAPEAEGESDYEGEGEYKGAAIPKFAESPLFVLDTRLESLDASGDGEPDDRFDFNQNGILDVLEDFSGNGVPDAFDDTNGDGIPDAYADTNGNGQADGFEDASGDGLPDFFVARYALYSPTHPRSDRWYFSADFGVEFPNYYPGAGGYLWRIDQDPDGVIGLGDTFQPASAPRNVEQTIEESGAWYFHIAAVDGDNFLIEGSQADFRLNAAMEVPFVSSSTHPEGTPVFSQNFVSTTVVQVGTTEWNGFFSQFSPARSRHTSVVFDNRLWVIGGDSGSYRNDVWTSTDGVTWTLATANAPWSARKRHTSVVFDNRLWVIGGRNSSNSLGNDVWSSVDGVTWTLATSNAPWSARERHTSVAFDNRLWVIGGDDGSSRRNDVWSSADGVTWTQATAAAPWSRRFGHSSVVFNNRLWVTGGFDSSFSGYRDDVWSSADGITWTEANTAAPWSGRYRHTSVVFNDRLWVIGGYGYGGNSGYLNDVWSSTDGVTWTRATSNASWSARWGHTSVVFNNRLWVIGGIDASSHHNDVWSSTDGVTWTEANAAALWTARGGHTSLVFNNGLWVIGGNSSSGSRNDVWSSTDGVTWTQATGSAPWAARDRHTSVVFNDRLWVIGGSSGGVSNDVWSSADGVTWTQATGSAPWDARARHTSVVFANRLWIIGGWTGSGSYRNDVWSSADGVTWTQATGSAQWSAREGHTSVVFANRLWVIGGWTGSGSRRNDVWSSADGVTWTQATGAAAWAVRDRHTSVVFNDRLWVIGGSSGSNRNDVWSSVDGVTWTQATGAAPWSARLGHTSVAFDNRLWVIGGFFGSPRNDVWSYGAPSVPASSVAGYRYVVDTSPTTIPSPGAPFSASPEISVPCNAPGEHWFHVVAVDTAGNASPAAHYRFEVLDAAPVVTSPTHPTESNPYGGVEVILEWTTPVPEVVRYFYAFDDQPDTEPTTATEATSLSFDCLAPGVYWFHVRSEDECGFLSPVAHRRVAVGVSPGPVVVSASHPDPTAAYAWRDVSLSWTPPAGVTGPYRYVWDRNPYTVPAPSSPTTSDTSLPVLTNQVLGRHFLHVQAVDTCGAASATTHFPVRIREARAPVVTVVPTSSRSNMTFSWTDPDGFATGDPKYYYAFDTSATTEPGPGSSSTNNLQRNEFNVPDGLRYFHVRSQDGNGNLSPTAHYAVIVGDALVGLSAPSEVITRTGPVEYLVTYPGATSVSLTAANVTLNTTGTATGTVTVEAAGDPVVRRIVISNISGDGTLGITIAGGSALFPNSVSAPVIGPSATFTVDNTPPEIVITGPAPAVTNTGPVTWTLSYTGAQDILLIPESITVDTTGTAAGELRLGGTEETRTITLEQLSGDGTLAVSVAPGTATDAAGNVAGGAAGAPVTVDNTPPTISLGLPSQILTRTGPVEYTVTYGGADAVTLAPGDITLISSPPGGATGAVSVLGSGLTSRTVRISNISGDGTLRPQLAAGTANDLAGNLASGATGVTFTVDNTPPVLVVSEPSVPATISGPVTWTLTYSGADTVSLSAADITLVATGTAAGDITFSGSGLTQRTITVANTTGDGILQPEIAEGTASDFAGNVTLAASGAAVIIDNTPPTIAIGPPSLAATTTGPVTYLVTYEGADEIHLSPAMITGLSLDGGTAVGSITVEFVNDTQREITVGNVAGDGLLTIRIDAGSGSDLAGNITPSLTAEPFLVDNTPPGLSIGAPNPAATNSGPVTFSLDYDGAAEISLSPEDITLHSEPPGAVSATLSIEGTGNAARSVRLTNITGEGSLHIAVAAGTAADGVGNLAAGAESSAVVVDKTPPEIAIGAPSASSSDGETVSYTITYTGAESITLGPDDITLETTGDATGIVTVSGSGAETRLVSIVFPSGFGTIGISIAAGTAQDAAGNLAPAAGPSETFSVAHYTLRMRVHGWGETVPAPGAHTYTASEEVMLTATAHEDARFLGWEIDGVIHTETPYTLTMDQDHLVTAKFSVPVHSGDQNGDYQISLSELLRVIQFFNVGAYHCAASPQATEDGYAPGINAAAQECTPHSSDYNPQNWIISLSELLRIIQFFNSGGYSDCPDAGSEDGFCPGSAK